MSDKVPLISVSNEADLVSLTESSTDECEPVAKSTPSKKVGRPKNFLLHADTDEESPLTDVESVEADEDDLEPPDEESMTCIEDLKGVLEMMKPHMVQISDTLTGKTCVSNTVRETIILDGCNVHSDLSDEEACGDVKKYSLIEFLTDVESLSSYSEDEPARSDNEAMQNIIAELGDANGCVEARDDVRFVSRSTPSAVHLSPTPTKTAGRRRTRKSARRRNSRDATAASGNKSESFGHEKEPVTDVEYLSDASAAPSLTDPSNCLTEVEDLDHVEPPPPLPAGSRKKHLAPGIVVTHDASTDDESRSNSGRSSRSDYRETHTDIEEIGSSESHHSILVQSIDGCATDVEEIDHDGENEATAAASVRTPRNGPTARTVAAHRHVVVIQEDENGRVTSCATSDGDAMTYSPMRLLIDEDLRGGGTTDVEEFEVSGDDASDRSAHSHSVTPDLTAMMIGDALHVHVTDLCVEQEPAGGPIELGARVADVLTDTEDVLADSGSDGEGHPGNVDSPPIGSR